MVYAKKQVALYNDEEKNSRITMEVKIDFNEKIKIGKDLVSSGTNLNIGYLYLQQLYHELEIGSFFQQISADSKITFDPNMVNRFMTFARILYPDSKLVTYRHLRHYKDIIEISSKRYKIEDCFRVMKTNFCARPVFHQTREHITAHFMICYTALNAISDLRLDKKYYQPKELKKKIKEFLK
ncbi:MAG: transposase [Clostridia bacterium]